MTRTVVVEPLDLGSKVGLAVQQRREDGQLVRVGVALSPGEARRIAAKLVAYAADEGGVRQ
jgi:hypothetical protein